MRGGQSHHQLSVRNFEISGASKKNKLQVDAVNFSLELDLFSRKIFSIRSYSLFLLFFLSLLLVNFFEYKRPRAFYSDQQSNFDIH